MLLYLRCISRGNEGTFTVKCGTTNCNSVISANINSIIESIENNAQGFTSIPSGVVEINKDLSIIVVPPSRNDMLYIQNRVLSDENADHTILSYAMSIKGYVINSEMIILNQEQREQLFDNLKSDKFEEIVKIYREVESKFYKSFGSFKCSECGEETTIDISDFILFFFGI
jgi:hypothetical protein